MKVYEITAAQAKTSDSFYKTRGRKVSDDDRGKFYIGAGYYATESDAGDVDDDTDYYYIYQMLGDDRIGTIMISNFGGNEVMVEIIKVDGDNHSETKMYDSYISIEEALPWVKETMKKFKREGYLE